MIWFSCRRNLKYRIVRVIVAASECILLLRCTSVGTRVSLRAGRGARSSQIFAKFMHVAGDLYFAMFEMPLRLEDFGLTANIMVT